MSSAISTRPDISNAVRSVARYWSTPKAIHLKAGLGILAYINGTSGFGITFQRETSAGVSLEVFADADYAYKATDRGSVSGGAITCGSSCVCWFSRTQKCHTFDVWSREHYLWLYGERDFAFKTGVAFHATRQGNVMLSNLCQGAVQLSQTSVSNSNSKHIDVRRHFLRELVRQGDISVNHVPSESQHTDILTKALAFDVFVIHRHFLILSV